MTSVREHYAKHLGPIYSWMVGGIDASLVRGDAELDALELHPAGEAFAVDLGAGFGMHAIPLARRGYAVVAVDSSGELLRELAAAAGSAPVRTLECDIVDFRKHVNRRANVVLCMGDTLTHLASTEIIKALFADVAAVLESSGAFVLSFRDYSEALIAERRFISVRSDPDRILTCFLEYSDAFVTVHDLLQEREGPRWHLRVSSYRKLRLPPTWVVAALEEVGFSVSQSAGLGGMLRLLARKRIEA